jgi:hypothetical protein
VLQSNHDALIAFTHTRSQELRSIAIFAHPHRKSCLSIAIAAHTLSALEFLATNHLPSQECQQRSLEWQHPPELPPPSCAQLFAEHACGHGPCRLCSRFLASQHVRRCVISAIRRFLRHLTQQTSCARAPKSCRPSAASTQLCAAPQRARTTTRCRKMSTSYTRASGE